MGENKIQLSNAINEYDADNEVFKIIFPNKNISNELKNKIMSKLYNISILSNKRMKDEFTKIFMVEKFSKSLSVMSELEIDKYILLDKNKNSFFILVLN